MDGLGPEEPEIGVGNKGEGGEATEGGIVRASGAHFPTGGWKSAIVPGFALGPPAVPKFFEKREGAGGYWGAGGVRKETRDAVEDGLAIHAMGELKELKNGNGVGEGGKGFTILGKAEAFCEGDPDGLIESVGGRAGGGEGATLPEAVPTRFFKEIAKLIGGKGEKG